MSVFKENIKVRRFIIDFFECGNNEFKDISQAKKLVESGESVVASGKVCNFRPGQDLRVKTTPIKGVRICKGHSELLTSSHVYVVN